MKNKVIVLMSAVIFAVVFLLAACESSERIESNLNQITDHASDQEENKKMKMNVNVNGRDFTAVLEQNSAADALVELMKQGPVTLQLQDYSGFEKVGTLGQDLPASDSQTTTHSGDIVLYQGNQIVLFYGSNTWSYTRLGHVGDLNGWKEALGSGDVNVAFTLEKM